MARRKYFRPKSLGNRDRARICERMSERENKSERKTPRNFGNRDNMRARKLENKREKDEIRNVCAHRFPFSEAQGCR